MADMLTPYRRHAKACPFKSKGNAYKKCTCPVWVQGSVDGRAVRRSADTRDWRVAQIRAREWEADGEAKPKAGFVTVEAACNAFRRDAEARGLAKPTLKKYRVLSDQLQMFSETRGLRSIRQFDLAEARAFRASWADAPMSAGKKLERLRAVCSFFVSHGWIKENYAKAMKAPIVHQAPTMPFTADEFKALIDATAQLPTLTGSTKARTKAMLCVLRYTGLRISDAVNLTADQLSESAITLRMAKTRVPVTVPLPDGFAEMLRSLKFPNGRFFSTGNAQLDTDTGNWRRRFYKLAKLAGVQNAHPHRLRDTFAVDLLSRGVAIEDVSILLGHASIKVTERHYAPWVQARQIRLENIIRKANQGIEFST
jgi:site-specific recombinase XerD